MRIHLLLIASLVAIWCTAQVSITTAVELTGPTEEQGIEGVSAPLSATAAMTVEGALLGTAHWASVTASNGFIRLTQPHLPTVLREGILLRFLVPGNLHGPLQIVYAADTLPLVKPDGTLPALGQLRTGTVAEVVRGDGRWVLLGASIRGCPQGSLPVNNLVCIETTTSPSPTPYISAVDICDLKGGKLCTWDEWYQACILLGNQMTNLFNSWEWVDDTANHDNHGVQVGLGDCENQRSLALTSSGGNSVARCCHHPR